MASIALFSCQGGQIIRTVDLMKGPLLLMLCLPGLAEELVHDPSRITTVGQYECVWWSGRGGAELKMAWRQSESEAWTDGPPIDINADGVADVNDILQVVSDFGTSCP